MVAVGPLRSFVMMDIPGLIQGAAAGAGLGIRFLKHIQRTRLLLHLVDILPPDGTDIVANIRTINAELKEFSDELARRDQWLVFNKIDQMPADEALALAEKTVKKLKWKGRWFAISSVSRAGLNELLPAVMDWVQEHAPTEPEQLLGEPAIVDQEPVKLPKTVKAAKTTESKKKAKVVKSTKAKKIVKVAKAKKTVKAKKSIKGTKAIKAAKPKSKR